MAGAAVPARAIGIGLFVLAALAALFPLARFRWPTREEALSRLDRGTGIRHRPATALTDTLSNKDPIAQALWREQRERTLASIKRIRAGLPSPRLPIHDPWALRALVMVMLAAAYVAAGDERSLRIGAAFDWNGVLAPANVRVDAWATPPAYTGKPPVILSAARDAASPDSGAPLPVPSGSTLLVRSSGGTIDVVVGGGVTEVAPSEQAPKGTNERHFKITGDGTAHVRAPSGQPLWRFAATPDRAPTISLAKDPERHAAARCRCPTRSRTITASPKRAPNSPPATPMRPRNRTRNPKGKNKEADKAEPRPLFEPPQFALVLPNARTRNGVGQTVRISAKIPMPAPT